jgi:hypothetical protein
MNRKLGILALIFIVSMVYINILKFDNNFNYPLNNILQYNSYLKSTSVDTLVISNFTQYHNSSANVTYGDNILMLTENDGIYQAEYNFKNDIIGNGSPNGWSGWGSCYEMIAAEEGGHKKVAQVVCYSGGFAAIMQTIDNGLVERPLNGTIEFYMRTNNTQCRTVTSFYPGNQTIWQWMRMRIYLGMFSIYNNTDGGTWMDLFTAQNNSWYHVKIIFNNLSTTNTPFCIYINSTRYPTTGFYSAVTSGLGYPAFQFIADNSASGPYYSSLDAVDYSWVDGYYEGRNLYLEPNFTTGYYLSNDTSLGVNRIIWNLTYNYSGYPFIIRFWDFNTNSWLSREAYIGTNQSNFRFMINFSVPDTYPNTYLYNLTLDSSSTYPLEAPTFVNITQLPYREFVEQTNEVNVTAEIYSVNPNFETVNLTYTTDNWASNITMIMNYSSNNSNIYIYNGTIPAQLYFTTVKYLVFVSVTNGTHSFNTTSGEYNYTVLEIVNVINYVIQNPDRDNVSYTTSVDVLTEIYTLGTLFSAQINYTIDNWGSQSLVSMSFVSQSGDNYTYDGLIPPQAYNTLVRYNVKSTIYTGIDFRSNQSDEYNYTTKDFSPPILTHTNNTVSTINGVSPVLYPYPSVANEYLYVNITDVDTINLTESKLYLNIQGSYQTISVAFVSGTTYRATIPLSSMVSEIHLINNNYFYYYWNITDINNNTAISTTYSLRLDVFGPVIFNVYTVPSIPNIYESTYVYCNVTDNNTVDKVLLIYSIDNWVSNTTVVMTNISSDVYRGLIPIFAGNINVSYMIWANDTFIAGFYDTSVFGPNTNFVVGSYIVYSNVTPPVPDIILIIGAMMIFSSGANQWVGLVVWIIVISSIAAGIIIVIYFLKPGFFKLKGRPKKIKFIIKI